MGVCIACSAAVVQLTYLLASEIHFVEYQCIDREMLMFRSKDPGSIQQSERVSSNS